MYISNHNYRIAELNKDNLKESARLLAKTFLTMNKVWATVKPTPEAIYKFMYDKTEEMLEWQQELRNEGVIDKHQYLNMVYLDRKDKIVGVQTGFELMQYLNKTSKIILPEFDTLEIYGKQLQESIDPKDKVIGLSTYGMFTAVDTDLMNSGVAMLFFFDVLHHLHTIGFRVSYGRCSNVKSFALIVKNGGVMTSKIKVIENDQMITLSFIKWEIVPFFCQKTLYKSQAQGFSLIIYMQKLYSNDSSQSQPEHIQDLPCVGKGWQRALACCL